MKFVRVFKTTMYEGENRLRRRFICLRCDHSKKLSFTRRQARTGLKFCLPFLLGFILFFFLPLIQSITYAFSALRITENGMKLKFVGLKNFTDALLADPRYIRSILETFGNMIVQTILILLLSLFLAVILNHKFRGRTIAGLIFFLPVIIMSGAVIEILTTDYLSNQIMGNQAESGLFYGRGSYNLLLTMGIPYKILETVMPYVYEIFNLVWHTGVQILIFMAGLKAIPDQLYESAKIDGCTAWESFWKITFPLLTPMLLMNTVYSIIDYCTSSRNSVIQLVTKQTSDMNFGYAAGLTWMYLLLVIIFIALVYRFVSRRTIYMEG